MGCEPDSRREERGQIGGLGSAELLAALSLVKAGRLYDLEVERFRGMPLHPVHPQMEVVTFRTPRGLRNQGDQAWAREGNAENVAFISDLVVATVHSGTHVDALSHITVGEDDHWYGGRSAGEELGDFGPLSCDAAAIPPIITRGLLLDLPGQLGVPVLERGRGISAAELRSVAAAQGTEVRRGDTVLVRTGYASLYPDPEAMAAHKGAGIDPSAASWLAQQGTVAVGGDTESLEQSPPAKPGNPHPVHTVLLVENGIYIIEMLDLEALARDQVHEFLFVALPCKIRGATGSMIRPVAIV